MEIEDWETEEELKRSMICPDCGASIDIEDVNIDTNLTMRLEMNNKNKDFIVLGVEEPTIWCPHCGVASELSDWKTELPIKIEMDF